MPMSLYDIIDINIRWLGFVGANKILKYLIEFYEFYFTL